MSNNSKFMLKAIELSIQSAKSKGGPFGCVIVKDNKIIAEGHNQVTADNDPTDISIAKKLDISTKWNPTYFPSCARFIIPTKYFFTKTNRKICDSYSIFFRKVVMAIFMYKYNN